MNKKGFTIVELLAVIAIIGILSTVAVFSYNKIIEKSRRDALKDNEKMMKTAAEDLLTHCASSLTTPDYCVGIPEGDEIVDINLINLINGKFINQIVDPTGVSDYCSGYVKVNQKKEADGVASGNTNLEYKVCLMCGHYKSSDCQ